MNIDIFAAQALEAAKTITGTDGKDGHTQNVAFKMACAMMAKEKAKEPNKA